MQNVSATWQTIAAAGNYHTDVKAVIGGVEYSMSELASLTTEKHPFGTDKPTLGKAVAGEINITAFLNVGLFPKMARIDVFTRLRSGNAVSEWIPKGTYWIDTREGDSYFVSLHGYDAMLKAERPYAYSSLSWPAKDIDVVTEIAAAIGVQLDGRTVARMTQQFPIQIPNQYVSTSSMGDYYTMRETLAGIAGLYGGSFIINDYGKLQLLCPWDRPTETNYLTDENGNYVTFGGTRILLEA